MAKDKLEGIGEPEGARAGGQGRSKRRKGDTGEP